ncbi:FAD-binding oxidoreductase [Aeromicrobium sp. A1-2]|uniref:FAD-binding oxidoreductase n=1 Tax=Aeromicrobium sp. A1-2 TaxID=2107713 RepID=UPI000E474B07|nr:FAD-linked oxidase C-terminal domain-containing protein [Aeromicrobium sp. A1-2]AXT86352.1 FAD-binding oxidoreductase [Aeromicrobium sp. A1-2]
MIAVVDQLRAAAAGSVTEDPAAMEAYRYDQCGFADAGRPLAVVHATSVDDVVATLKIADATATPVVTRGTGTGLAGAANAIDGCIVLSTARLDSILDIDPVARTARVQPGVINGDLDRAAAAHGLWYAPDPGSRDISSIGGNMATNAGGMCCAKYGVTADHALQLTAVLAGGEIIRTGSATRKDVAGLDLTRLLVGSEGTLAVIVEATVRLRPRPAHTATVAATFPTARAAIAAVLAVGDLADPSAVEVMDRTTVAAINAMTQMGLDESAGAVMLIQCDGPGAAAEASACAALATEHGATEVFHTDDPDEGEALMQARRVAYTALERLGTPLLDDVCVAVHRLPDLLDAIEQIAEQFQVTIGTFGHAADGNLHPTIVFDPADADAAARARSAFDAIVRATLALDGTLSGEHGIGVLKAPYLSSQFGEVERALMSRIKAAFDPNGVLNPGKAY